MATTTTAAPARTVRWDTPLENHLGHRCATWRRVHDARVYECTHGHIVFDSDTPAALLRGGEPR